MSAESFCEKELLIAFESREVHYCCVHRVHRLSNSPIEDDSRRAHRRVQLYLYAVYIADERFLLKSSGKYKQKPHHSRK